MLYDTFDSNKNQIKYVQFKRLDKTIDYENQQSRSHNLYIYKYYLILLLLLIFIMYASLFIYEKNTCIETIKKYNIKFNCLDTHNSLYCYHKLLINPTKFINKNYSC